MKPSKRKLSKEIDGLEKPPNDTKKKSIGAKSLFGWSNVMITLTNWWPTIINEFVEKILVHERDRKGSQTANQKVEIYCNFIGNYEPPKEELSEEENAKEIKARRRKRTSKKDRLIKTTLSVKQTASKKNMRTDTRRKEKTQNRETENTEKKRNTIKWV